MGNLVDNITLESRDQNKDMKEKVEEGSQLLNQITDWNEKKKDWQQKRDDLMEELKDSGEEAKDETQKAIRDMNKEAEKLAREFIPYLASPVTVPPT